MIKRLTDIPLNLVVGKEYEIPVNGNFYHIIDATEDVYISVDHGKYNKRAKGLGEEFESDFTVLKVQTLVAQAVLIVAGFGRLIDAREVLSVTVSATVTPPNNGGPVPDVTLPAAGGSTLICAARSGRKNIMIKGNVGNDPDSIIRVAPNSVAAGSGVELVAGEGVTIESEAAIYGINNDPANDFTVSIVENYIT